METKQWAKAFQILVTMRQVQIQADMICYSTAVGAFEKAGQWQLALSTFWAMHARRMACDELVCSSVISACGVGGRWEEAIGFLSEARQAGLEVSLRCYNVAMSACERNKQWQQALNLLALIAQQDMQPDTVSFNASIKACETCDRWGQALLALRQMRDCTVWPDERSYTAAISACAKVGLWQHAAAVLSEMPLHSVQPNVFNYNATISACEQEAHWNYALALLSEMMMLRISLDVVSFSAAMSVCGSSGEWHRAIGLLATMRGGAVEPNLRSHAAVVIACEKKGMWQPALELLRRMQDDTQRPDAFVCGALISACASPELWQRALAIFVGMQESKTTPDLVCCNALLQALQAGNQWMRAQDMLLDMQRLRLALDESSYTTALSAYDKGGQWQKALEVLATMRDELSEVNGMSWSLAISACDRAGEWEQALEVLSLACRELPETSLHQVAWAFVATGARDDETLRRVAEDVARRPEAFDVHVASGVVWTFASLRFPAPAAFVALGAAFERRLEEISVVSLPVEDLPLLAERALRMIWSFHAAGVEFEGLLVSTRRILRRIGRRLDRNAHVRMEMAPLAPAAYEQVGHDCPEGPAVVLDLVDRFVISKPPNWQCDDVRTARRGFCSLSTYMSGQLPHRRWSIFDDPRVRRGYLHRLDVPSSGLLLAARDYLAFYDLQLQMHTGCIQREYVVVCHGWMPATRIEVDAPIFARAQLTSEVSSRGKPSLTRFKVLAHALRNGTACSLLLVQIATGRNHQIRLHSAHIGVPLVFDTRYLAKPTVREDMAWSPRNFLHRYRLGFLDDAGSRREATAALPSDLVSAMLELQPRDTASAEALRRWAAGQGIKAWDAYNLSGRQWH